MTAYDSPDVSSSLIVTGVKTVGMIVSGIVSVVLGVLYVYQDNMLYYPSMPGLPKTVAENPKSMKSPEEYNIKYEDFWYTTKDGCKIHSWLLLQKESPEKVPTIVYFHGNAGNIGFRLPNANQMYKVLKCNILMVDYRGYGYSKGTPSETGLVEDGRAALEALKQHSSVDENKIIVFGRSLGGGVALALADLYPKQVMAIIVENTFTNIPEMVDELMPYVSMFKGLILKLNWPSKDRVTRIKQPILFLSGLKDELVPPSHMKQLYELCISEHKEIYTVENGTHNDTWHYGGLPYYEAMARFISQLGMKVSASKGDTSCDIGEKSIPIMPNLKF